MAKDRSKKILREISASRDEILERLDRIEARLGERPADPAAAGLPGGTPQVPVGIEPLPAADVAQADALPLPPEGEMRVVVRPLRDLSLARAVETALAQSDGVERATLRELRGDSATIDVLAREGFSVVASLRQHLPVAFDVTESDERSVTIAMAQPGAQGEGGVAAPGNQ